MNASTPLQMDASGRLVLPRALRTRLNLSGAACLHAEVVAGRLELTPVAGKPASLHQRKDGLLVVRALGKRVDAAAGVVAEHEAAPERGLRR